MTQPLTVVSTTPDGDHVDIVVAGDLDYVTSRTLTLAVDDHVAQGIRHVTLDASALTFCDSVGLGALVNAHKTLNRAGGGLTIAHLTEAVADLFALTGLDAVLTVVHPENDAG